MVVCNPNPVTVSPLSELNSDPNSSSCVPRIRSQRRGLRKLWARVPGAPKKAPKIFEKMKIREKKIV